MPRSSQCIIFLLLFMLFKLFIRICNKYNIHQLTKKCIFLTFSAHIDDSILKSAPMSSDYKNTTIFQSICHTLACSCHIPCVTRKCTSSIWTYTRFNCFFYRTHANLISWLCNVKFCFCNSFILSDIIQCGFFLDCKNTIFI